MNEKIYFAASIRGGRKDAKIYSEIIEYMKQYGEVLTEHIADKSLDSFGSKGSENEIHAQDMSWLEASKNVVAEVTQASLGVGYELGRIVERNFWVPSEERKNILCLYRPQVDRNLSAMIMGCPEIKIVEYKKTYDAFVAIDDFFIPRIKNLK